jgi:hypothetical protein
MTIKLFTLALDRARAGEAEIILAWSRSPTLSMAANMHQAMRMALGRDPLSLHFARSSAGDVRHAFIRAVCSGSSVLATGLETLDPQALDAALLGLASVNQWNKSALGVSLSSSLLAVAPNRFKAIHTAIEPEINRSVRM